jgi:CYTH domain-containing protein
MEIERKYLVNVELWRPLGSGTLYRQGYLSSNRERVVRVRIVGDHGFLTVKGATSGISRLEFEYPIPREDAAIILDELCERPLIVKTRHREVFAGRAWEIDVFHGDNDGLVVAEIEVASPVESIGLPPWVGAEVSNDPRYFNSNLVAHPYKHWGGNAA